MSVFTKTTEKIKNHYKNKQVSKCRSSKCYNKTVQICPNLDRNGAMKSECEAYEELQCQLCWRNGADWREPNRSCMTAHIRLDHAPDCPNCNISFKSWRLVSEHQPFCVHGARIETRTARQNFKIFSLANKVCPPSDWSFGESDYHSSDSENWSIES